MQTLTELLDERKSATSQADLVRLSNKYGIDVNKLQNLTRFVTSPSVTQASTITNVETETGDTEVIMEVSGSPTHSSYILIERRYRLDGLNHKYATVLIPACNEYLRN